MPYDSHKVVTSDFKLSAFLAGENGMGAAKPGHLSPQLGHDVMDEETEGGGEVDQDVKQHRLHTATHSV